jgi:hypothetical protein
MSHGYCFSHSSFFVFISYAIDIYILTVLTLLSVHAYAIILPLLLLRTKEKLVVGLCLPALSVVVHYPAWSETGGEQGYCS